MYWIRPEGRRLNLFDATAAKLPLCKYIVNSVNISANRLQKFLPVIHRHIDLINVPMLSREYFYDIKLVSGFSSDCPNDWIVTRLLNPIA